MTDQLAIAAGTPDPLTGKQRVAFLAYIREHPDCSVREAADHVGAKRKQVRHLKATDEQFAADYRDARGYGDDKIRDELRRRAIEGVVEPVFGALGSIGGNSAGTGIVGERRVYSDRLLGMMAKANLPEYRDRVEHTGADGGPLEVKTDVAAALDRFTTTVRRLAERGEPGGAVRELDTGAADAVPGGTSD